MFFTVDKNDHRWMARKWKAIGATKIREQLSAPNHQDQKHMKKSPRDD